MFYHSCENSIILNKLNLLETRIQTIYLVAICAENECGKLKQ